MLLVAAYGLSVGRVVQRKRSLGST